MPRFTVHPRSGSETRPLRIAFALLVAASLTGCMAWKSENVAPVQSLKTPVPATLRVTLVDGETRYLEQARIEHDSLIGNARATSARWSRDASGAQVAVAGRPAGRTSFPLAQVARTDAMRVHAGKTAAVAVPTVGILGLAFLIWVGSGLE